MNEILIVDDEEDMRSILRDLLEKEGYTIHEAEDGRSALNLVGGDSPPDLILLDLITPGRLNGIELLKNIKAKAPKTPVIILTGYGNIQSAVDTIKLGAYDYLTKPFENERLRLTVKRALESQQLAQEVLQLRTELKKQSDLELIMGSSLEIKDVFDRINKVAATNFTVLLEGESGTGKEIVANAIYRASLRREGPFVAVDCGAIPETLIESELFGYEKGAFTGAEREKKGQFELANNGTIFLDETGNLPYHIQNKLLRMIQERKIQKLGGKQPLPIDIRIIVACNLPLLKLVEERKFRADLYYRLNEFKIELPPLRKRKEDIPFLAKEFITEANIELKKNIRGLHKDSLTMLINHHWPGNVRELKNVIKRGVLLAEDLIEPSHLVFDSSPPICPATAPERKPEDKISLREITKKTIYVAEKKEIELALSESEGNKTRASKMLKINYKTLLYKIKQYDIKWRIQYE
jgi:DNA-binding NtrC family response regulator